LTWAGVLVNDVFLSRKKKKTITPKQHMWLLRISATGIAVFVFLFSMFFDPGEYLWMFFQVSGAIYAGGAGVVILGALYWRKGTVAGAWAAMFTGLVMGIGGLVIRQIWPNFPYSGMQIGFLTCIAAILMYVIVSLCKRENRFDLDALLNRTKSKDDSTNRSNIQQEGFIFRNLNKIMWAFLIVSFLAITYAIWYNTTHEVPASKWINFWKYYAFILFFWSIPITIWMIGGGFRDLFRLFKKLRVEVADATDDGLVHEVQEGTPGS
jgi:SSS family solute:Na+ symporter